MLLTVQINVEDCKLQKEKKREDKYQWLEIKPSSRTLSIKFKREENVQGGWIVQKRSREYHNIQIELIGWIL